jgi:hypothetical protein
VVVAVVLPRTRLPLLLLSLLAVPELLLLLPAAVAVAVVAPPRISGLRGERALGP